ncbi:TDRD1_4_6_7 [Mytilus coruscus]|uniref:TDRD1_4_6_7 n=1 Tax=Mytilus coruscus TaxID=42192 RepID=A0A6J8AZE4_MYTCO|nr:TDRD1_4_6_7 [Mytilus coruscus]
MITIEIQEIKSPGHFFCREIDSETASLEHQHFLQLQEELNQVFNQEQTVQQSYIPSKGEICIAFRQKDRNWYRVRNEGVFARKYGQEACCYFVDKGGEAESISVRWLRKSPKKIPEAAFSDQRVLCIWCEGLDTGNSGRSFSGRKIMFEVG